MIVYFIKENTTHFHLNAEEGMLLTMYKLWHTYLNNIVRNITEVLFWLLLHARICGSSEILTFQ